MVSSGGMPRIELPPALRDRPFALNDGLLLGVGEKRLSGRDLIIPYPGVRDSAQAEASLLRSCAQFAARMKPWQFFSHETALAIVGAPMPPWPYTPKLHVSAYRPAREPRVRGIVGHRLQARDAAYEVIEGFRVAHPVRAWCQAGLTWSHEDMVAAGDYLVTRGVESLRSQFPALPHRSRAGSGTPVDPRVAASRTVPVLGVTLSETGTPEKCGRVDAEEPDGGCCGSGPRDARV